MERKSESDALGGAIGDAVAESICFAVIDAHGHACPACEPDAYCAVCYPDDDPTADTRY